MLPAHGVRGNPICDIADHGVIDGLLFVVFRQDIERGQELSEAEVEQLAREMLLADVLEAAAAKLRCGEGWEEATTTDVLNEIEHATGLLHESYRRLESED